MIDTEVDVAELKEAIKSKFGIPIEEQIIRFMTKNYEVRVLSGFNLDFYEIGNNAFLQVSRLELNKAEIDDVKVSVAEEENLTDSFINRMAIFNRLQATERAANIESQNINQVEDSHDEFSRQISDLKTTFMEITKNKMLKEFQHFLETLLTLDLNSQIVVLQSTDNVGWTGIHYAVSYNEEFVISELLKYFNKNILNFVSKDGWSPIFLAVHNKYWNLFNIMIKYADLSHLELQTSKGSLLHYIFKTADFDTIEKLILEQDVDLNKKDFNGKMAIDFLSIEKQEQALLLSELRLLPAKPISLLCEVEDKGVFYGWNKKILHLNSEARTIEIYSSPSDYPFKPDEIILLHRIERIKFFGNCKEQSSEYDDNFFGQMKNSGGKKSNAFKPNDNFLEFVYDGSPYKYRIKASEQATILELSLNTAIEWARYYDSFITKIKYLNVKEKAMKIWKSKNKNFEEYFLSKKEDIKKLMLAKLKMDEEKIFNLSLPKVGLIDFDVLKFLGKGSFGKVYKVLHKRSKKIYAMKVLSKRRLMNIKKVKYSLIEKRILEQNINNPFLLSLYSSFQTVEYLFLIIDFCPNGDLSVLLNKQPECCLDERAVKIYTAEIILAIEDLHKRNYIYRDLKPENVLIDETGHLKLADFGLAAENIRSINQSAKSVVGSPVYFSPETLKSDCTYKISDFYTIGVLLYELLTGIPPFYNDDEDQLYELIKKGIFVFPTGSQISEEAQDLIRKLIVTNPKVRLGCKRGIVELKEHPFFQGINWDRLFYREVEPPITFSPTKHNYSHKIVLNNTEYNEKNFHVNYLKGFDYVRENFTGSDDS